MTLEFAVFEVHLELLVWRANRVFLDEMVKEETLDQLVPKENLVFKACLDFLETKAREGTKAL